MVATAGLSSACSTLPRRNASAVDDALPPAATGTLADYDRRIEARLEPEESAYWLLERSRRALEARLALADEAVSSLDVQYFIWESDATGNLLAARLLDAADRGVRVRLLLDDLSVLAREDVVKLDAHPLIEVRVFNPWAARRWRLSMGIEFLSRSNVLNHRMHNKTFIADNRFAIVGGRNIGDRYFGLYRPFVQNDLDVLLAGPVVPQVSRSFDVYWNAARTYPVRALRGQVRQELAATKAGLVAAVASSATLLESFPLERADWNDYLDSLLGSFSAGPAELYYDPPGLDDRGRSPLYAQFKTLVGSAQHEVLISSPYFIPDRDFRDLLRELTARGVRVAIVTNSLATNNQIIAHTGYKRWRRAVLAAGVELYELRADAAALGFYVTPPASVNALGLHAKAVVIDGERAFIGSPNVDPRSMLLNTEVGVATDSAALAGKLKELIERDMAPANAWRVTLDDDGWLHWSDGSTELKRQPAKGFRQRAIEFLLNLLPLKKQV